MLKGSKLGLDDLKGVHKDLIISRRQREFYSLCLFGARTKSESLLFFSTGKINYLSKNDEDLVMNNTLEMVEGYCEYRLKQSAHSKYFDKKRNFKKGDVVFIDEVYALMPLDIIIADPEMNVLKRHFK